MAYCPSCNAKINDDASDCEYCGKKIIPASQLEKLPGKITGWQKFVIAVSILILVAIGLTFQTAEDRENAAAQQNFSEPVADIVRAVLDESRLARQFGIPRWQLQAETKSATLRLNFPRGPLSMEQAALVGRAICASLARVYVKKGYMPRQLTVWVTSSAGDNKTVIYGKAAYNGNLDMLAWEPGL